MGAGPRIRPRPDSNRIIDLITSYVSGRQGIAQAEATAWAEALRDLGAQGDYFFSLNRYLFIPHKP
jgi:arsenite methyltransferase